MATALTSCPTPNLQTHLDFFVKNDSVTYLGREVSYRDIYAKSKLVITDYSSAVFDFAYLRKPVLYTQFDAEEFFSGKHTSSRGYFDYARDGFGEVTYDLDSTVDRIIEYMENDCRLKDVYRERIDNFFAFDDQNNCARVLSTASASGRERPYDPFCAADPASVLCAHEICGKGLFRRLYCPE